MGSHSVFRPITPPPIIAIEVTTLIMGHIMAIHTTGLIGITITTGIDVHIGITVTNHRKDTLSVSLREYLHTCCALLT